MLTQSHDPAFDPPPDPPCPRGLAGPCAFLAVGTMPLGCIVWQCVPRPFELASPCHPRVQRLWKFAQLQGTSLALVRPSRGAWAVGAVVNSGCRCLPPACRHKTSRLWAAQAVTLEMPIEGPWAPVIWWEWSAGSPPAMLQWLPGDKHGLPSPAFGSQWCDCTWASLRL